MRNLINEKANSVNEVHDYIMHPGEPIQHGLGSREMSSYAEYNNTSVYNHSIPSETRSAAGNAPNPFMYTGYPKERI